MEALCCSLSALTRCWKCCGSSRHQPPLESLWGCSPCRDPSRAKGTSLGCPMRDDGKAALGESRIHQVPGVHPHGLQSQHGVMAMQKPFAHQRGGKRQALAPRARHRGLSNSHFPDEDCLAHLEKKIPCFSILFRHPDSLGTELGLII